MTRIRNVAGLRGTLSVHTPSFESVRSVSMMCPCLSMTVTRACVIPTRVNEFLTACEMMMREFCAVAAMEQYSSNAVNKGNIFFMFQSFMKLNIDWPLLSLATFNLTMIKERRRQLPTPLGSPQAITHSVRSLRRIRTSQRVLYSSFISEVVIQRRLSYDEKVS